MWQCAFLLFIAAINAKDPNICCKEGDKRAAVLLQRRSTCNPDGGLLNQYSGLLKNLCHGLYKGCCTSQAASGYCKRGVNLALTNRVCSRHSSSGGERQQTCCECCKRGIAYGLIGGSCFKEQQDALCSSAFETCCNTTKTGHQRELEMVHSTCNSVICPSQYRECKETPNGARCVCKEGMREEGNLCVDINECNDPQISCPYNSYCANKMRTYECICNKGYEMKENRCVRKVRCGIGYEIKEGKCQDIDECVLGTHGCPKHQYCLNINGWYTCESDCPHPFYEVISIRICQVKMAEESVKVAVRVRPFNAREKKRDSKCIIQMSGKTTTIYNPSSKKDSRSFTFDYSYWSHDGSNEDTTGYLSPNEGSNYIGQKELFQDIGVEILSNSWHGYNTCLIAYGQTGSGKSWSIFGYGANKGIVPQFCTGMFKEISAKKKDSSNTQSYEVFFSMLEIYNERVYDLLSPYWRTRVCKVRQHPKKGFYADGLNEVPVKDGNDIDRRIEQGMKNRTIAETNFNESSSRAHTIIGIKLIQKSTSTSGVETAKTSEINLVDLAGSERVTRGCAEHIKEGAAINQSLSNLGNCIAALVERSEGKDTRIPFRYSVLTKLLKNALSGNSKTIMIAALSPADMNYVETLSTLRYADRAKQIKIKASVNEDPTAKLIRELREENRRLQKMFSGSKIGNISGFGLEDGVEEEFAARVAENKRLLNQMDKKWEEKLAEAEEYDKEMIELRSRIEEEKKVTPHIFNLSPDPILIGMIVFLLKSDSHTIGRDDQNPKPYIPLKGVNILKNHGEIKKTNSSFTISKHADSRILVNGVPLTGDVELHHNDRILIGTAHLYIFSNPEEEKRLQSEGKKVLLPSYEDALEEIVVKSGIDGTKIPDVLRKMIDFLPHLNEANGLSEDLDRKVQYEPIIITPAVKELILLNEDEDLYCKVTQLQTGHTWFWSRDKLLAQKFQMQEMYLRLQNNEEWDIKKEGDPFVDPIESNCLVGVTQVFIKSIAYLLNITVNTPLIDYRGLKVGQLEVSIVSSKCDGVEVTNEDVIKDNPMEVCGKTIDFSINISQGWIPHKYIDVFCQYSIFTDDEICTKVVSAKSQNIIFDHSKELSIEVFDKDVLDYILNKSVIIEVWGKQLPGRYKPYNQAAKLGKSTRQIMKEAELLGRQTSIKPKVSIDEFKTLSNYSLIDKRHEYLSHKLARIEELCQTKESEGESSVPIQDIQLLLSPKSQSFLNSTGIENSDESNLTELTVSVISGSNQEDENHEKADIQNGDAAVGKDESADFEGGDRPEDPLEGLESRDENDVSKNDIALVVNTSRASNRSYNDSENESGSCACILI